MIIGFTGRRDGMSEEQKEAVNKLVHDIIKFRSDILCGVHGDCVGADEDFDKIVKAAHPPYSYTKIRPCTYENMRAFCDAEVLGEPKPPMQRNREIVADATIMIACPPNKEEIKRGSGTWATIKFTRKADKPLYIVFPDGEILKERTEDES